MYKIGILRTDADYIPLDVSNMIPQGDNRRYHAGRGYLPKFQKNKKGYPEYPKKGKPLKISGFAPNLAVNHR